jgi:hypothetical protein
VAVKPGKPWRGYEIADQGKITKIMNLGEVPDR